MRELIRRAPPAVILAAAWLVLFIYAFPGQMSWDSYEYLHGARIATTDQHPPAISAIWSLLEIFVAGPTGMLILQSGTFLVGLWLLLARTMSPRAAAWAAAGLLVFPPIMVPMAAIWGHSLMAGFLLLGVALLLAADRRARIGGLAALALAVAVRPSALVATLPLIVMLFEWQPRRRYAIAAGAWLATVGLAFGTNALLTERQMHRYSTSIVVHDIAGVLRHVRGELPDEQLRAILQGTGVRVQSGIHAAIKRAYSPYDQLALLSGPWNIATGVDAASLPDAQSDALQRARRDLVLAHPGAYLRHRLRVFKATLGLERYKPAAVLPRESVFPDLSLGVGVPTRASDLQHNLTDAMTWLAERTPLFAPWCYLVVALLLVYFVRRDRESLSLLVSGIAFQLALFAIASDHDFRQSHWMIVVTCLVGLRVALRSLRA